MSFTRLEADDFVVSSDAISSTCWTTGNPTLSTFFTSSTQANGSSGNYYLNVYNTASNESSSAVQFAIAYGNSYGSGSANYNSAVNGKSPTRTIWGQWQDLVLGDENASFVFGTETSLYFYAVSVERARYKEKLLPGTMTLHLSGSGGELSLTDNSLVKSTVTFTDAGRVYDLVSGSAGTVFTGVNSNGYSANSGSYGLFLPDIGTLLLNGKALDGVGADGGISLGTGRNANTVDDNPEKLYNAFKTAGDASLGWTLNSEETLSSDYIFVRARNSEFNYSENPSFISGSTGEVIHDLFIDNPTTYITTVGLYNDNQELLAVAKLSRPLPKNFTKELLVRVKLDY